MMQNDMFELMAEVGKVLNIDEDIGKYNKLADRYEYDYELWEEEGKRFVKEEFIQAYASTKTVPTLNDGLAEFIDWLRTGYSSGFFFVQWVDYERSVLGKNFLQSMLNAYQPYEQDLKFAVNFIKLLIEIAQPFPQ